MHTGFLGTPWARMEGGRVALALLFVPASVCWLAARVALFRTRSMFTPLAAPGVLDAGADGPPKGQHKGKVTTTPYDGSLEKTAELLGHVMRLLIVIGYVRSRVSLARYASHSAGACTIGQRLYRSRHAATWGPRIAAVRPRHVPVLVCTAAGRVLVHVETRPWHCRAQSRPNRGVEGVDAGVWLWAVVASACASCSSWRVWCPCSQFAFVAYHYYHAVEVYNYIRVFVSAYVWMTGFGNFSFFYTQADFSFVRMWRMLWRLNFSVVRCHVACR